MANAGETAKICAERVFVTLNRPPKFHKCEKECLAKSESQQILLSSGTSGGSKLAGRAERKQFPTKAAVPSTRISRRNLSATPPYATSVNFLELFSGTGGVNG